MIYYDGTVRYIHISPTRLEKLYVQREQERNCTYLSYAGPGRMEEYHQSFKFECRAVPPCHSVTICETDIFANNVSTHLQGLSSCTLPYGTLAIDWTTVLQYSSAAVASFALPASNVLLGATY